MSGVYGNMLLSWPEQYRSFTYFNMTPKINDSYNSRTDILTILGVIQNAMSMTADSNGNLVQIDHMNLWTESQLERGRFIEFNGLVYRIIDGNDWPTEGGFYNYTIEKLVGSDGSTADTTQWSNGSAQF